MNHPWHLYVMAFLYIIAGINHFRSPRMYQKIIPSYFSNPVALNYLSGAIEILLGIGLMINLTTSFAAWGIILLLIGVFPVHIHMISQPNIRMGLPLWALYLRLPIQFILIYWAYTYC
ncbi:MAG: DoxX family protein [Flavobacterium sp.]